MKSLNYPLSNATTNDAVMLSGLKGMSTWCDVCYAFTDHNTLYHQDIINLHREQREDA